MLLSILPAAAAAFSASAWLLEGRSKGQLKLGMLPFLLEHVMMPGETRNVFIFDDSLQECVQAAAAKNHNSVGGLLMDLNGDPSELVMLLRIDEIKLDADETCLWVKLACISRCLVRNMLRNKRHGYRVAVVSPYSDGEAPASAYEAVDSLQAIHSTVAAQRRRLQKELLAADSYDSGSWEALGRGIDENMSRPPLHKRPPALSSKFIFVGADKGRAPFGIYDSFESYDETGVLSEHVYLGLRWERPNALGCCYFNARDLGELDDEENGAELADLIATRQKVLTGAVPAAPAAAAAAAAAAPAAAAVTAAEPSGRLLDGLGDVWSVESEEEGQLQLLSLAAAATLSPMGRAEALMMNDTAQRLAFAREELRAQQELLTDLLAK